MVLSLFLAMRFPRGRQTRSRRGPGTSSATSWPQRAAHSWEGSTQGQPSEPAVRETVAGILLSRRDNNSCKDGPGQASVIQCQGQQKGRVLEGRVDGWDALC